MDRLISEQAVLDVINEAIRIGRFYCGKERTIEEIKAIPSAEPCEDAISRQAVLGIVDSYSESQSNVEDVTQDIISDIVVLPSVKPKEERSE